MWSGHIDIALNQDNVDVLITKAINSYMVEQREVDGSKQLHSSCFYVF